MEIRVEVVPLNDRQLLELFVSKKTPCVRCKKPMVKEYQPFCGFCGTRNEDLNVEKCIRIAGCDPVREIERCSQGGHRFDVSFRQKGSFCHWCGKRVLPERWWEKLFKNVGNLISTKRTQGG